MPVVPELILLTLAFAGATAVAEVLVRRRWVTQPALLQGFFGDIGRSFTGWRWTAYAVAVLVTVVLVLTGLERAFQDVFQTHTIIPLRAAYWALFGGEFSSLLVAIAIIGSGWLAGDRRRRSAGVAALQAVLVTFYVTRVLKRLSGRRGPLRLGDDPARSRFHKTRDATDFDFAFWDRVNTDGRFFWPSGHTASAFTLVSALVAYYPEHRWIAWVGYPAAALMGLAMIEGDFHWLSDVIAGALIGHVLGWSVGKRARKLQTER